MDNSCIVTMDILAHLILLLSFLLLSSSFKERISSYVTAGSYNEAVILRVALQEVVEDYNICSPAK